MAKKNGKSNGSRPVPKSIKDAVSAGYYLHEETVIAGQPSGGFGGFEIIEGEIPLVGQDYVHGDYHTREFITVPFRAKLTFGKPERSEPGDLAY